MSACCHVDVPIRISHFSSANISGYSLRLNYDENLLTEPELVAEGTQSDGSEVKLIVDPPDGFGNLSLGLYSFMPNQQEILIKLRFRVSMAFTGDTPFITFVGPNQHTVLFKNNYETIPTFFKPSLGDLNADGNIDLSDAVTGLKTSVNMESDSLQLASEAGGDKKIDVRDVVYILKFLAGL